MPFVEKNWIDEPELHDVLDGTAVATSTTPVDAAALEDMEDRLSDYTDLKTTISVKEPPYNAAGDGVTDDTAAIQAAIDAVRVGEGSASPSTNGGMVYFPKGYYRCDGELDLEDSRGVVLRGPGGGLNLGTTLKMAATIGFYGDGGTQGFINARSSRGFEVHNMGIEVRTASTTDLFYKDLINLSHSDAGNDANMWRFENFAFDCNPTSGSQNLRSLINATQSIFGTCGKGRMKGARCLILWQTQGYSNAHQVHDVVFADTIGTKTPTNLVATPSASGGSLADDTYYYEVTAMGPWMTSGGGEIEGTRSDVDLTATVSGGGGSGRVVLNWDDVTDATDYRVYVGLEANNWTGYFEVGSATSTFTHTTQSGLVELTPPFGKGAAMWNGEQGIEVSGCSFENMGIWEVVSSAAVLAGCTISDCWLGDLGPPNAALIRAVAGSVGGLKMSGGFYSGTTNGCVVEVGPDVDNASGWSFSGCSFGGMENLIRLHHPLTGLAITGCGLGVHGELIVNRDVDPPTAGVTNQLVVGNNYGGDAYDRIDIQGHLASTRVLETAPSITAGAGAGTGPTLALQENANDMSGTVSITTGTSAATGVLATITFAQPYRNAGDWLGVRPKVMLTPAGANAAALSFWVSTAAERVSFTINATGPASATAYTFDYFVVH